MQEYRLQFDETFSVPFTHRLRFTRDVFDPANPALADVLPGGAGPARVLAFGDQGVLDAQPGLAERVAGYARAHRERIELVGPLQPVPGGEQAKNDRAVFEAILKQIHDAGLCRQSYVLVIGGGAVLDVVGFAAAIAHRGLRLVRLPTTTLAQADSGLGVKTSINAFGQKNYLGVFAVPWAVLNDDAFPATLSDRDFRCGFAEAVKVALIKDAAFFADLCAAAPALRRRDMDAVRPVLQRAATIHLHHITRGGDPFELTAARPLDFGHWSAHKLEQLTDFQLRHGEAVAIGVALDTVYSALAGLVDRAAAREVIECLHALGFATFDPALRDAGALLQGLDEFRAHLGGRLTVPLLAEIGRAIDVHEIDGARVLAAIAELEGM